MTTSDTRPTTLGQRTPFNLRRSFFGVRRFTTPNSSFLTPPSGGRVRRSAFTLIEMLIVISIISVLLGMLYGSLERARKFSRRVVAYTEVKNIESALKQYYSHYHDWPPASFINSVTALSQAPAGGDTGFIIDANAARMLQGTITDTDPQVVQDANPDRIPFIEFARFVKDANGLSVPVNPFRVTTGATETRQYKVQFDSNNDSEIQINDNGFQTNVFRTVVVWTVIPGSTVSAQNNGAQTAVEEVLGSWDTFNAK